MKNKVLNDTTANLLSSVKMVTQKIGTALSGMIMPIIGIIIAWGLLTAFFIPTGWTPVKIISDYVVGNLITWLIPIMIGFLGGKQVYGLRGAFIGAAATAGIVAGAQMFESGTFWSIKEAKLGAQFLGAMISGPLCAYILKKIESVWEGKIKPGFEMLVDNFTLGIVGMALILFSFFLTPWIVWSLTWILEQIVNPLTENKALPVTSFFVEPAKPLFLNNAINHGVFSPLGIKEVQESGKSILFYIESNPGPGLGILLAYVLMDKRQRGAASSASVVHFFGGIHEVYFPFIIMRPILVIAAIAGGATGVAILQIFDGGAIAPASPGSVIALFTVSYHSGLAYAGLALSIASATGVSFIVALLLMKFTKNKAISKNDAIAKMNSIKGKSSKYVKAENYGLIKSIIFACDAGMGSSAMGAGILRNLIKKSDLNIKVKNVAIRDLSQESPDLVIVQDVLSARAKIENPAEQFIVKNFMEDKQYKDLIDSLRKTNETKESVEQEVKTALSTLIKEKLIVIGGKAKSVNHAIDDVGKILLENKIIEQEYIKSMHKRNADISVNIGNSVAIPHGQSGSEKWVKKSGISITTFPNGIKWGESKVKIVIGIASKGGAHMDILSQLAIKLSDQKFVDKLALSKTKKEVMELLKC